MLPRLAPTPLTLVIAALALITSSCSHAPPPTTTGSPEPSPPPAAKVELARTPPMGFNDWNAFGCDVSEKLIKETADFFVSSGLKDAGYTYVNIDDCWSLKERGPDGKLVPDPVKFPSGIRGVADYVHGLGLKLGIYGDAGTMTCAGYPGSLGKEKLDAKTWAEWGVDYLKYDNCYNQSDGSRADFVRRYTAMREALDETGRPMVYSICEWGQSKPWEWAKGVGHLWRTTGDISDNWASVRSIIAFNAPLAQFAGPGHWNDPDMLEIGNGGMSPIEYRTHMSLWAMMAAPLIIGTDLRKATPDTLAILENRKIIAINQDELGRQATVVNETSGTMVFAKPLANGDVAVALYNPTDTLAMISVNGKDAGLPLAPAYRLENLWSGLSTASGPLIGAGVPAHGTVVYRASALDKPAELSPAVAVSGSLDTLIPSVPGGTVLTASAVNGGVADVATVSLELASTSGWSIKSNDASKSARLAPGEKLVAHFTVTPPPATPAGSYPMTITAHYAWGEKATKAVTSTELLASVVVPPPDGVSHLSELAVIRPTNALGPAERDTSNGAAPEGDGNLLTIGGNVYTRGLGTRAPSDLAFYLGGRCSSLTVDVGLDDEVTVGAASFEIHADNRTVAKSGVVRAEDPPRPLKADLTGARWLRLVTLVGDANHPVAPADWAQPLLTCGKSKTPTHPEHVIYSFEAGTDGIAISKPAAGGSFAPSTAFHTDGKGGLEVTSPADGNWYGRSLPKALDLSRYSRLAVDVKTGTVGTVAEFAVEVGPEKKWCQGGGWAWVNPSSSKTIKTTFSSMHCPGGAHVDPTKITGVWVFIKASTVVIDRVRAE